MATGSPTYRTRPMASSGSAYGPPIGSGAPSLPGSLGGGGGDRSSMSCAVNTATAPGAPSAADASTPAISACAIGLRTNVTRAAPISSGSRRSST